MVQQDAMMMDVGLRDKPPGDPPDGGREWVEKVVGGSRGGNMLPGRAIDEDFVRDRLQLEFPDGEEGEPVITIGQEVLEAMNGLWKRCMILKVLNRNVGISVLQRKLRELWKPVGWMQVTDLPRQFFMVRFEKEEEYFSALTGGPWRAFGSHLLVQAWSPEFDPMKDDIVTTPVWIRLLNVPMNFYHPEIIMGIAKGLGNPLRVDLFTLRFERARYARVCVAVDLSKSLKGSVMVNGERYFVAYEGLTNICSKCGVYGHLVHGCPQRAVDTPAEKVTHAVNPTANREATSGDGFVEVRRSGKQRSPPAKNMVFSARESGSNLGRNLRDISGKEITANIVTENRFGSLVEDTISSDLQEITISEEANKENMGVALQTRKSIESLERAFVGPVTGGKRGHGNNSRERRAQPSGGNGLNLKQQKQNRPMGGKVFGPTRNEIELSVSGKRLRVEGGNSGRPGGVFMAENSNDKVGDKTDFPSAQMVGSEPATVENNPPDDTQMTGGGELEGGDVLAKA